MSLSVPNMHKLIPAIVRRQIYLPSRTNENNEGQYQWKNIASQPTVHAAQQHVFSAPPEPCCKTVTEVSVPR